MSKSSKGRKDQPGKQVAQKSGLNRAILDGSPFELRRQLKYKTEWRGGRLYPVPPQNTSRSCPVSLGGCGLVSADKRYTSSWEGPMRHLFRVFASFLVALCVTVPASALDTPLSDEAVREAYFLGQRHDASFLTSYIKFLPMPKTGPHISSVTFSLRSPSSLSSPASTSATTAPSKPGSITAVRMSLSRLPLKSI